MSRRRRRYFEIWEDNQVLAKRQKRLSHHESIEQNIEELMIKLSLDHNLIESNLENLVSVLEEDLTIYHQKIKEIFINCALKMPDKCTIYTTLIGLLNLKNPNFSAQVIEAILMNFRQSLELCKWNQAKYLLRFLADLVNCNTIQIASFMQFLDYIIDNIGKETGSQVRKDAYAYLVLSCLPWVGKTLYEKKEKSFERMLVNIQVYLGKRKKNFVPLIQVWSNENLHIQEDFLDCLLAQILKLKQDKWVDGHIFRPYLHYERILAQGFQYKLPLVLPPPHRDSYKYPLPKVVFRLFDYTDCPEEPALPGAHTIHRYLIEEHLDFILETFHLERKDCARELLNVYYKDKVPLNYCIVEVIFADLFNLPKSRFLEIAYGSIFIELCKQDTTSMPQILAQATEIIFMRIPTMNLECLERFINWFTYHLSNFNFEWTWDSWSNCASLNREEMQPKFLRETFEKILRLSYYKKVKDIIPDVYKDLIPAEPVPNFKFINNPQELAQFMSEKTSSPDEVIAFFERQEHLNNPTKLEIFMHYLLNLGTKTFTHTFSAISKYFPVLKYFSKSQENHLMILESIFEFWKLNHQKLIVIIMKLLKIQIITCSSVINWIFSEKMKDEFMKGYIWELLHLTIKHTNNVIAIKQTQYEKALKSFQSDPDYQSGNISQNNLQQILDTIELAEADKKNLLLSVFQNIILLLSNHLNYCEQNGKDFTTYWYRYTIARLKQMFLNYHYEINLYLSIFEMDIFDENLDINILLIFKQFVSLKE